MKIGIIGVGNLGSSIANGLLKSGFNEKNLYLSEHKPELLQPFNGAEVNLTNNIELVQKSDLIIFAVKPFNFLDILADLNSYLTTDKTLVSVVTGTSISEIENATSEQQPIFRAMPNTAISTQESITCIASKNTSKEQISSVDEIFNLLGEVIHIDENLMDAATVLGACGIAYVMRFLRAMTQGGIEIGFSAEVANKIAIQTMRGATQLLVQNHTHPEQEIDKVTTPKGCTIAGLNEMEHQGFSSALIKGVLTSFEKI